MSYIVMTAEDVRVRAQAALRRVKSLRDRLRAEYVAEYRASLWHQIVDSIFGLNATDEQILATRALPDVLHDVAGWHVEDVAEKLLLLADNSPTVMVSGEDLEAL